MYFYIQEIETKRESRGCSKEIILGTKTVDGLLVNTYEFGKEHFIRPIKKAYRITLHKSYRENGTIKKKQQVVTTINYYDIAESCIDDEKDFLDSDILWFKVLDKLDRTIEKIGINPKEEEELVETLQYTLSEKTSPLFCRILSEYTSTEEYEVFMSQQRALIKHENMKRRFLEEHDALGLEYDACYDFHGNLTNPVYLEKIKARTQKQEKHRYQETKQDDYKGSVSKYYTEEQRKLLKQFYRVLGKSFHPDANTGVDTSEQMKFLNKLKEDWGV